MNLERGAGSQANPRPICVLQVEDNPMDALLLAADFSKQGPNQFRLTSAVRLSEAIQVLASTPIDVILLDLFLEECTGLETLFRVRAVAPDIPVVIVTGLDDEKEALRALKHGAQDYLIKGNVDSKTLPGMDGLGLTRRIKANPAYSGVVIVALTAYAMKGDEEKALRAGCDGYVSKPINTRTLPRLIREYIDGRRPAAKSPPQPNGEQFTDSSIIDLGALSERVGTNTALMREIVQIFFDRYPAIMAKAQEAMAARNFKEVERTAHSIRGYLVNFHARRASEAALQLEIKGRLSDSRNIEGAFSTLEREIELLAPLLASLERKQAATVC